MLNQQATSQNQEAKPLVTFVITYYNLPVSMLTKCIDSILTLSLRPDEREIIVVDDGSETSPVSELARYMNDIIYVRQKNGGLSEARNRGIQMASGEYLQFVDADDYLVQNPYEHCLDIVRFQKSDIVMFDFTNNGDDSPQAFDTQAAMSGTEYLSHNNLQATAWGYLFRRSMLGSLRFTPGIYHEDEEFTPQLLLRAETVCSTDAQAYFYNQRPHSITSETDGRKMIKRLNDKHLVIKKLNLMADRLPHNERMALQRRVAQLTMDYIYNIIMQTRSRHYLDRKLSILRREGLFPLPDRDYTTKYKWFRRMTNSSLGLSLLMRTLPLLKKER